MLGSLGAIFRGCLAQFLYSANYRYLMENSQATKLIKYKNDKVIQLPSKGFILEGTHSKTFHIDLSHRICLEF